MATYKVLQDIEAEDTLIGPLTVRQCLYAAIAVVSMYLSFVSVMKGAPFLVIFLLPFILFGLFFAFPWSKQQPTEIWALAKIRFYFKPRKRIWNQTGVKELVTITAPRTVRKAYTSNLSPNEVQSRLKALADTIDSRGWAVKNVDIGYYTHTPGINHEAGSDRLVSASSLPQASLAGDVSAAADIFDVRNNPVAQKFDVMMSQSAGAHRQQIMQQMSQQQPAAPSYATGMDMTRLPSMPQAPVQQQGQLDQPQAPSAAPAAADYWHMPAVPAAATLAQATTYIQPDQSQAMQQPAESPAAATQQAAPQDTDVPTDLVMPPVITAASAAAAADYSAIRTQAARPLAVPAAAPAAQTPVTAPTDPAILELANNNDLNVATIAREAQARHPDPPDEVVVSFR